MKKLLYIVPAYNPTGLEGVGNRVTSFCNCFTNGGYHITVVAMPAAFSFFKIFRNRKNKVLPHKCLIIPIINAPHRGWINNIFILIQRIIVWGICLREKPDFVLADAATGINLTKYINKPIIGNFRADFLDEYKSNSSVSKYKKAEKGILKEIHNAVKFSDFSICVSKRLKEVIEKQAGISLKRNFIFPCCAKISRFQNVVVSSHPNIIMLGYFGGLQSWQCVEQVIEITIRLRKLDDRYKLLILTGSKVDKIQHLLDELGKENYILKAVSQEEIPDWVGKMDISFALRSDRSLNRVSSPTKLRESLAAGVPIVVTEASGDWDEVVSVETGMVIPNLRISEKTIADLHNFCLQVKANRIDFFDKCRNAVANHTWEFYSEKFIKFIEK